LTIAKREPRKYLRPLNSVTDRAGMRKGSGKGLNENEMNKSKEAGSDKIRMKQNQVKRRKGHKPGSGGIQAGELAG
jgi:hypothetical protein